MASVRSVYVHVPFCSHRCGYCNFTLLAGRDDLVPSYLDAVEREFKRYLSAPLPVDTLFLGGGTPSFLPPDQLQELLELIGRWFLPGDNLEYSCEVNPIDCQPEKLRLLREAGVNRISLGGQSFSKRKLKLLERDHSPEELRTAVQRCHSFFDRVSLDLIFATPDETLEEWKADLDSATSLDLRHLSTYGLTIESGSAFFSRLRRGELEELDNTLQGDLYELTIEHMTSQGWTHYEVSNFANNSLGTEEHCRHNEAYWLGKYWWGFGPGAASFLPVEALSREAQPEAAEDFAFRSTNHPSTMKYIRRLQHEDSPKQNHESVNQEQYIRERLVFGLRRLQGVHLETLAREVGENVEGYFQPYLKNYLDQGWLERAPDGYLRLTRRGLLISDAMWPDLLVG
ncbi:MAG: radical SAM family heme chaperone HemW [Planctomycetota bacterium]